MLTMIIKKRVNGRFIDLGLNESNIGKDVELNGVKYKITQIAGCRLTLEEAEGESIDE